MHTSNDRYFRDRRRHDLALRMIRHEARTCTIRSCTGLSDDRIRRLYKTYASYASTAPLRRRRGKSPRQLAFFTRNTRAHFESSLLASVFVLFGLLSASRMPSLELGTAFCDAFETHRQLLRSADISFEHAWFLLQQLNHDSGLRVTRCRHCDSHYVRDRAAFARRACPACKLTGRLDGHLRKCSKSRRHGPPARGTPLIASEHVSAVAPPSQAVICDW